MIVVNPKLICESSLPVLSSPAFDKAHANGTHPGELVHSLKPLVDRLGEQGSKLLVVEDLQVTSWREQPKVRSQRYLGFNVFRDVLKTVDCWGGLA